LEAVVKTDKERAAMRKMRKALHLTQNELAALAGIPSQLLARFERGKHVSLTNEDRISGAIFKVIAKKNPEAMARAMEPVQQALANYQKILAVEPGSELAQKVEQFYGKSLVELKLQAEGMTNFLGAAAQIATSLTQ
jgi:transcriptional regulator with XRE-family HTH domain